MELGVFTVLFADKTFEEMLDKVASVGLKAIEIGTGAYPGNAHCPLDDLLEDEAMRNKYLGEIVDRGLMISAFSCHGNPISPDKQFAKQSHDVLIKTVKLASLCQVSVVNCFSGTCGDNNEAKNPCWPVAPWPNEYSEILK